MKLFHKSMNDKYKILKPVEEQVINDLNEGNFDELYVALYTSNYRWWSRLIKWWTKSPYSHCEFLVKMSGKYFLIGISDDQRVRVVQYDLETKHDRWEFIDITDYTKTDSGRLLTYNIYKFFNKTIGAKYDWRGIIWSCIFARRSDDPNKYTCSEWVITALDDRPNTHKVFPRKYQCILPSDVADYVNSYMVKKDL